MYEINYKEELNPEQLEVVETGDGACLVLAGAGSGKTRTLVYRVAKLIEQGVDPANILLVTFTNKASREMMDRVSQLLGKNPQGLWGGTFHHIGHRILRQYHAAAGLDPRFTIVDKEDSHTLIRSCIGELNINTKEKKFPRISVLGNLFSYAANSQLDVAEVIRRRFDHLPVVFKEDLFRIYDAYQAKKRQSHILDFDDLLIRWLEMMQNNPKMRDKLSGQFTHVLVDEYQDTNRVQSSIIRELSRVHGNVLVVGDDSQSIYSFRAADVNHILEFPRIFSPARLFKLERNYRSTPEILQLANSSIKYNQKQFDKQLRPENPSGQLPQVVATHDGYAQASFIVDELLTLNSEGHRLRDIGILFRAAYQIIELELELNKRAVPYVVRGGLRFFEQAHIKDVIAYLRIVYNIHDELAWKRVLHLLPGIGPATAQKIWLRVQQVRGHRDLDAVLDGLPPRSVGPLRELFALIGRLSAFLPENVDSSAKGQKTHINGMVQAILESGYKQYLKNAYDDADDRREDIVQMGAFSASYESLEKFLADSALTEGFKGERNVGGAAQESLDEDHVVVSTIHQAKGLEWRTVFVVGLVEGQFPHHKVYNKPQEMEEERRLFYVAATRAEETLFLTYSIMNHSKFTSSHFNHPSTFIHELPEEVYQTRRLGSANKINVSGGGILDRVLKTGATSDDGEIKYIEEF